MSDAASVFGQLAQNETALQQHDQKVQGNAEKVFGQMAQPQGGTSTPGPTIGPAPKASDIPLFGFSWQSPEDRLSMPLAKGIMEVIDKLDEVSTFTQEGRAEHPIQAKLGDAADALRGYLFGGAKQAQHNIGSGEYGMATNPVTAALIPTGEGGANALTDTAEGIGDALSARRAAKGATVAGEKASGLVKQVVQGEKVAQPAARSAIRGAATAAATDTGVAGGAGTGGIRTLLDDTIGQAATKERGLYDTLNKAAGTDMKDLYERAEELQDAIDDPTNIVQKPKLQIELKRTEMQIANGEANATKATGKDAQAMLRDAKNSTQQRYALQDLKAKVFNNEGVVQGNAEHGAEESINVNSAIKSAEKLNKPSRFAPEGSPTRLEQALGEKGASDFLSQLYAAQKQGQTALAKQKVAKIIGKTLGAGGIGYEVVKSVVGR